MASPQRQPILGSADVFSTPDISGADGDWRCHSMRAQLTIWGWIDDVFAFR